MIPNTEKYKNINYRNEIININGGEVILVKFQLSIPQWLNVLAYHSNN